MYPAVCSFLFVYIFDYCNLAVYPTITAFTDRCYHSYGTHGYHYSSYTMVIAIE